MKPSTKIFYLSFALGIAFACKNKASDSKANPIQLSSPTQETVPHAAITGGSLTLPSDLATPPRSVVPWIKTRQVSLVNRAGESLGELAIGGEGPGLWLYNREKTAMIEMGIHSNGFPFLLVTDYVIRNFGLGRVDGKNASPIMVFRSDDVVKMVFGLSMTEAGQPPFLVYWGADNVRKVLFGNYCDNPGRACTN